MSAQDSSLSERLSQYQQHVKAPIPAVAGILTRVVGLTLEAKGLRAPVGSQCKIETMNGFVDAEIVGFNDQTLYLMPNDHISGVLPGARVIPQVNNLGLPVGMSLLGRVVDGLGRPLDGLGKINAEHYLKFAQNTINPLSRRPISKPMDVGVRAINSVITVGQGQRMGLFAGSGVGKSVLLGMMTRGSEADVIVVGLVGERGREVKEFIEEILGVEGRKRSVVVAAPADSSPLMRLKGCESAVTIAEYFRDQGLNVLLLLEATKGYPPSVFAKLPALVERAGNGGEGQGSITAFFTVLSEGDDMQDPIADAARAILDGHIVLSRDLADSGHYPAIDIEKSISRVMPQVVSESHMQQARVLKQVYSMYQQNKDMITLGAYQKGTDQMLDQAINMMPRVNAFLQQGMRDVISYDDGLKGLAQLLGQA